MSTETNGKVAVLASGGIDSAILVAHLARSYGAVQPIYIRFGLAWEAVEEQHLRSFLATLTSRAVQPLVALDLPVDDVYGAHWSVSGEQVPDDETPDAQAPGRQTWLLPADGRLVDALALVMGEPRYDHMVLIVDHLGRVALMYPPGEDGHGVLADLKRLLRVSAPP